MTSFDGINVPVVLASLKGFQRRSVDYVFERLYGEDSTRRFLLADEAGLGKTLVARGVIAKTIEHLRACGEKRIDIVYICSNADIARQNISRLNVTGKPDFQLATRITLLPQTVSGLAENPLNFSSFTPGTSFDLGHSPGQGEERKLLYWLLRKTWPNLCQGTGAKNVLQGRMSRERFRLLVHDFDSEENIDRSLAKSFREAVRQEDTDAKAAGKPTYQNRFRKLCQQFARSRKHVPHDERHEANTFVGDMRALLAKTCIKALEPDLIILDEFQRFKNLLNAEDPEENPAGVLAKSLFTWEKTRGTYTAQARVLLLSATPYKMYTLSHERETDNHYKDFAETLRFLLDDESKTEEVNRLLTEYGRACARIDRDGPEPLRQAKQRVEAALSRVMCRTEKLAVTEDRSGMLRGAGGLVPQLNPKHILSYLEVRRIADAVGHPDVLEYWKSSPYLLNFMETDHYKLKGLFVEAAGRGMSKVASTLSRSSTSVLSRASWEEYGEIDLGHALLECLAAQTVDTGWWRMLWMPPSYPYYDLSGPFVTANQTTLTKRLVFSSWHVVPRAISVLLSYRVERLMVKGVDPKAGNKTEDRERRRPQLTFSSSGGRLAGLPVLAMLYPSIALAGLGEPLSAARGIPASRRPTLEVLLAAVAETIRQALLPLLAQAPGSGQEDESWYWAAPILLDRMRHQDETEAWFSDSELAEAWSGVEDDGEGWREHVKRAGAVALGKFKPKGRPPHDLAEVLALGAVAGPANCALRALANTLGGPDLRVDGTVRHAAGRIAWGFRSLFNTLEVNALVRSTNKKGPYWRRVLEYSAAGCLQSVLDEYLHVLVELEALGSSSPPEAACQLAEAVTASVGLRTATPGVDWVEAKGSRGVRIDNQRVRARFAMRFGDEGGEYEEGAVRKDAVRAAFNSPFWPFVLATTSIGQEGLDFHPYCHAVMHWNLPSNPVDMEQREGRVHRYKGHAVRKNVAKFAQGSDLDIALGVNPWHQLFQHAVEHVGHDSDISPYWVFPIEGGAAIERHTPALPLSREAARVPALCASLAVYRMVFGQPRQDDLVEHLKRILPESDLRSLSGDLSINLEPPPIGSSPAQGESAGNHRS